MPLSSSTWFCQQSYSICRRLRRSFSSTTVVRSEDLPTAKFEYLRVVRESRPYITHIELNRPDKKNAINMAMWDEIGLAFDLAADDSKCRAVVLSAAGTVFSAGIDLSELSSISGVVMNPESDIASKSKALEATIKRLQTKFSALEKCLKPVLCAVDGPCVGAGINLVSATDIRLCTNQSWFQVKEVDMGLAADVGVLQRLPKLIGSQSLVRDLCLTGRRLAASEAKESGFVSSVHNCADSMIDAAFDLAVQIVSKSPVAVQGTKLALNHARDHSVDEGLEFIARHNASMIQSKDFQSAVLASLMKQTPVFNDL